MNKNELIAAVAAKTGTTKKDAGTVINATLDVIVGALSEQEAVHLVGFGTFDVKKREARTGLNPKTKQKIDIPASKAPVFKAGKPLKDAVSK